MNENTEHMRFYDITGRSDDIYFKHYKTEGELKDHLHFHSKYELMLVLGGECEVMSRGRIHRISKPFIMLQPPFSFHKINTDGTKPFDSFIFYFGDAACTRLEAGSGCELRRLYGSEETICELDALLYSQATALTAMALEKIDDRMRSYILAGLILITDIASGKRSSIEKRNLGYLSNVVDCIHAQISTKLSAEELAKQFFVSEQKLQNDFKRYFGETLHQYCLSARVSHAAMLIARGKPPLAASIECGFVDEGHFSKVFKSRIGVTPNRFAKQVTSNIEYSADYENR